MIALMFWLFFYAFTARPDEAKIAPINYFKKVEPKNYYEPVTPFHRRLVQIFLPNFFNGGYKYKVRKVKCAGLKCL